MLFYKQFLYINWNILMRKALVSMEDSQGYFSTFIFQYIFLSKSFQRLFFNMHDFYSAKKFSKVFPLTTISSVSSLYAATHRVFIHKRLCLSLSLSVDVSKGELL